MTKEQLDLIKKPLPKEAVTQHPTRQNMSTIKAIYVTERLNDVFGVGSWTIKTELVGPGIIEKTRVTSSGRERIEFTAVLKTVFEIPDHKIYYECIASSVNDDPGDACKGATTDAITKISSYVGIGIDVFKGKHDSALQSYESESVTQAVSDILAMKDKNEITDYAKSLDDSMKQNQLFRKAVSDKLKSL